MPRRPKHRRLNSVTIDTSDAGKSDYRDSQPLLPGLPDHLAQLCLSLVLPSLLYSVCRSWRRLIYSPSFPPFLSLYAILSHRNPFPDSSNSNHHHDNEDDPIGLYSFDPISGFWSQLPPPNSPLRRIRIDHPSFISRSLPIQSVATGGHLVLVAASNVHLLPALPHPLAFHPLSRRWILGPRLRHPRRWCAAGSASGAVYIVSGVGSSYRSDVARSAERWEPSRRSSSSRWEPIASLRDGRFSREAINAVAAGGKLCMVNVEGRGAKQGLVYDIEKDVWEEMPLGMLAGWTGPVASPSLAEDGDMYVVDEVSGEVRAYKWGEDRWKVVAEASEARQGAVVAAVGRGKMCVAVAGGGAVEVLDVGRPGKGKTWSVEVPKGGRVIALHVLPRMTDEKS
ncbi:F-box/kelch-repeat protein SKIP25 [Phalaenopsis equestris]|uniref:F-box/kelch-repeat protein SKIP25 n=1 Tax=Phalaenopsis equestris TaxID=78828 RepID=UPI0009E1AFBD|nr:F-box/kelch-repeat protein SKIP25 [Phalaenopsis equestris]